MVRYPDFLRHIVNAKLAEYSKRRKDVVNIIDEVRKLISKAETKYGFSSFGGNPEKLANYLKSEDFELVISTFKSVNAVDILIDILREVADRYKDLPRVKETIEELISGLEGVKMQTREGKESEMVRIIKEALPDANVIETKGEINVSIKDKGILRIKKVEGIYELNGELKVFVRAKSIDDVIAYLKKLFSII